MSNALEWAAQIRRGDVVRAPFANVRTAQIDPGDIAAVAATALTTGAHDGRSYRLSGPEALLAADRLALLAPPPRPPPRPEPPPPPQGAAARRRGARRDEPGHAGRVRRRLLLLLRRRHPRRVGGPADGRAGPGPPAAHVRRVGRGARRRVPLTQPRGTTNAAIATKCASAAAMTKRWKISWKPKTDGAGSGRRRM